MPTVRFNSTISPFPRGGHFLLVPSTAPKSAGVKNGDGVRGSMNGVPYRSSMMKSRDTFHIAVDDATIAAAKLDLYSDIEVTLEPDDQPLAAPATKSTKEKAKTKARTKAKKPTTKRASRG